LFINYRSFEAVAGCPLGSSFSRMVCQHTQCTELAEGQLSRFHHKGSMASKFDEYKPYGLSRVRCNVGDLPQA